mmetsp:Transcript_73081/g.107240  ORF Transcript_73081/g.107240 Transcript_73081/m.107240 type:complete len:83 (-) Transcript_73081:1532-1780(-)
MLSEGVRLCMMHVLTLLPLVTFTRKLVLGMHQRGMNSCKLTILCQCVHLPLCSFRLVEALLKTRNVLASKQQVCVKGLVGTL